MSRKQIAAAAATTTTNWNRQHLKHELKRVSFKVVTILNFVFAWILNGFAKIKLACLNNEFLVDFRNCLQTTREKGVPEKWVNKSVDAN